MKRRYNHTQTTPTGVAVHHDYEHSGPLLVTQRLSNYRLQNGGRTDVTVRQQRQIDKAAKRALAGVR